MDNPIMFWPIPREWQIWLTQHAPCWFWLKGCV